MCLLAETTSLYLLPQPTRPQKVLMIFRPFSLIHPTAELAAVCPQRQPIKISELHSSSLFSLLSLYFSSLFLCVLARVDIPLSLFMAFASSNFFYFWSFEQKWSSCVCYLYVDSKVPKRRRWCTSKPQRPTAVPLMSTGGWLISYLFIFLRKTCFQFYSHIWEKNGWHAQIIEYLMGPRQLVFRIRLSFLFLK